MIRLSAHIFVAAMLTILIGALWTWLPTWIPTPDIASITVLYLGLRHRDRMSLLVLAAMLLGYLCDLALSTPTGLMAFSYGVLALLARLAAAGFLLRGIWFVSLFAAIATAVVALLVALIRIYLDVPGGPWTIESWMTTQRIISTALCAPVIFWMNRHLDVIFADSDREEEALKQGFLP